MIFAETHRTDALANTGSQALCKVLLSLRFCEGAAFFIGGTILA